MPASEIPRDWRAPDSRLLRRRSREALAFAARVTEGFREAPEGETCPLPLVLQGKQLPNGFRPSKATVFYKAIICEGTQGFGADFNL